MNQTKPNQIEASMLTTHMCACLITTRHRDNHFHWFLFIDDIQKKWVFFSLFMSFFSIHIVYIYYIHYAAISRWSETFFMPSLIHFSVFNPIFSRSNVTVTAWHIKTPTEAILRNFQFCFVLFSFLFLSSILFLGFFPFISFLLRHFYEVSSKFSIFSLTEIHRVAIHSFFCVRFHIGFDSNLLEYYYLLQQYKIARAVGARQSKKRWLKSKYRSANVVSSGRKKMNRIG